MSITATANTTFEATTNWGVPGLLGVLGFRLEDGEGDIVIARAATGIIESPAGSGVYTASRLAPFTSGSYLAIFDDGDHYATEELLVTSPADQAAGLPPAGVGAGPCSLWTTAEGITGCCDPPEGADLDYAAEVASVLLWDLSGRRYGGRCRAVVRPQDTSPACGVGPWGQPHWPSGCRRLTTVRLAGWPVRVVEEVRLDGVILDPAEYRLFNRRELVRVADGEVWPSCQYLERDPTEEGTFQVTYVFGQDPPVTGQLAAAKLACEVAKACAGAPCALPPNLERVVRQGVQVATKTARDVKGAAAGVGIPEVDLFLAAAPRRRRTAVASPDTRPYPLVVSVGPAGDGS